MFSICSSLEEIDISNFNGNYMTRTEKSFTVVLINKFWAKNFLSHPELYHHKKI